MLERVETFENFINHVKTTKTAFEFYPKEDLTLNQAEQIVEVLKNNQWESGFSLILYGRGLEQGVIKILTDLLKNSQKFDFFELDLSLTTLEQLTLS